MSYNKVFIEGTLTADPYLTDIDGSCCTFNIEVNGTEFFNVITKGSLADFTAESFKTGDRVFIEGRIHSTRQKRTDKRQGSSTILVAEKVIDSGENDFSDKGNTTDNTRRY